MTNTKDIQQKVAEALSPFFPPHPSNAHIQQHLAATKAAIAQMQPLLDEMAEALLVFDEAMRNGSTGAHADKHKAKALRAAHKKAKPALTKYNEMMGVE